MLKERLPKEVRLNGKCSSGADDDRNDRLSSTNYDHTMVGCVQALGLRSSSRQSRVTIVGLGCDVKPIA